MWQVNYATSTKFKPIRNCFLIQKFLKTGLRDFCKFLRFSRSEVGRPDFSLISSIRLERFWSSSLNPSMSSAVKLGFPYRSVHICPQARSLIGWQSQDPLSVLKPRIIERFDPNPDILSLSGSQRTVFGPWIFDEDSVNTLPLLDSIAFTNRSRVSKASEIVFDNDSKFEIADFNFFSVWSRPEFKSSFFVTRWSPPIA